MQWQPIEEFKWSNYKEGDRFVLFHENKEYSDINILRIINNEKRLYRHGWYEHSLFDCYKYFLKLEKPTGENE